MKLVTICIPTYNSEDTLHQTLTSILEQSYSNLVVKIFDNASSDKTIAIANEFALKDQRFRVFSHFENIGAEGNFNRCIQAAEGEYTAIFHADDVYEKEMLTKQVEFLDTQPNCVAVATGASIIDAQGVKNGNRFLPPGTRKLRHVQYKFDDLLLEVLKFGNFITCPSVMVRTEIYREKIKSFRGELFGTSADLDAWLRLSQIGSFGLITYPLMQYRVSKNSYTTRETKKRFTEHDLLLALRYYLLEKISENDKSIFLIKYLQFHEFKDAAARRLNIILSRRTDIALPKYSGSWINLAVMALQSSHHFKFVTVSIVIFFCSWNFRLVNKCLRSSNKQ
jgi:glycosyltransferase involved in cell wall biosynthesis